MFIFKIKINKLTEKTKPKLKIESLYAKKKKKKCFLPTSDILWGSFVTF
jgi:hypothetical protein